MKGALLIPILMTLALSGCGLLGRATDKAALQSAQSSEFLGTPSSSRLRMQTRTYVGSVFNDVFGPSAAAIAKKYVTTEVAAFGGPCDSYAGDCPTGSTVAYNQVSVVPVSVPQRAALLTQACNQLTAMDAAVIYAIGQAQGGTPPTTVSTPTTADLLGAYDLFFRGKSPSASLLESLGKIVASAQSQNLPPLDQWRFLILTLCLSPDWQIP